jgi:glycosyltransferase involved in cell wall biosynthesis
MKKRIAFISEHASPLALLGGVDSGGQNVYVARVASILAKQGYLVDVFTRCDNPDHQKVVEYEPGVRVVHVDAGPKIYLPKEVLFQYMDEFASDVILFMEREKIKYELIHAHFWMSGYVAALIKNILNIPYVITFHALGKIRRIYQKMDDGFPDERFKVEEMVARESDMVIAECPQDKEDLIIHYLVDESKIQIVPCGFDKEEFYPINKYKAKLQLGLDPSELIVLQLGRMVKRKGVDNVIEGVSKLKQLAPLPVRLLIVGGESDDPDPQKTPELGRLMEIANQHGIADSITFTGRKSRKELKYYYNAADIFVTTPWYEPFGITPLESMACGTPVIGANVGGIKYTVAHGKTGFLVPANDPDVLAQRMFEIFSSNKLVRNFRLNAIERVNTFFTWEKVGKSIAGIYEQITKAKKPNNSKFQTSFNEVFGFLKNGKAALQLNQ